MKHNINFLFIYPEVTYTNTGRFQRGIAYLSAGLKKEDHQVGLITVRSIPSKEQWLDQLQIFQPDIIGFSAISAQAPIVRHLVEMTKELGIFTIWGGVHATLDPESSIMTDGIDAVCRGEADIVLPRFVNAFASGQSLDKIESFYVKTKDKILKAPVAPLLENLDDLPFPDYDIFPFNETEDFTYFKAVSVLASRGCPFNCSYCANNALRYIYPNHSKYCRIRSVRNVLSEIEYLIKKYPAATYVRFSDDTLSSSMEWFEEFCKMYKEKIGLPYSSNERAEFISEEKADLYRDSGCVSLDIGIENGNEMLRFNVMNRKVKNETIIKAFHLLAKRGIRTNAFNILGMPTETSETVLDTIKLNAKCNVTHFFNAYFHPFISTDAYKLSEKMGLIDKSLELPTSLAEKPVLKLASITETDLIFYYKFFAFLVRLYTVCYRFFKDGGRFIKILDAIIKSPVFSRGFLNKCAITTTDFKKRFPLLSRYLVRLKRAISKPYTHA
ncbi:MAG: radical SAM protein [Candidatus Omnitrophota bacterium]|jgi:radical SAM superfamily enzyme YgiQ (UPF0313 family)